MRKGCSPRHQTHFPMNVTQNMGCASTLVRLDNEQQWVWIGLEWVEVGWMDLPALGCATATPEQHLSLPSQSCICTELTLDTAPAAQRTTPGALSFICGAVPLSGAQWTIPFDKAPHKHSQLAETKLCCFTAGFCTSAPCFTTQERLRQLLSPLPSSFQPPPNLP